MLNFFLKKLSDVILTLVGITFLCFILIRLIPGDPVLLLIGEKSVSPEVYMQMKKNLGLDKSMPEQFIHFAKGAITGDLGTSIVSKNSVWEEFKERFPATIELGLVGLFGATILAIPLGIIAALKRNSFIDYTLMGSSLIGFSMPIFWWGLLLILVFSVHLGLTPVSGRIAIEFDIPIWTGFYLIDTLQKDVIAENGLAPFWSAIKHLILPSIALGTIPLAILSRMTRSSLLEVLGEDFVRTAKAKGLSSFRVVGIHALRNALVPIVTTFALLFGTLITGAILTESIFSWPGIGKWIVQSLTSRDYPVIQGGVLIISFVIIMTNVAVDFIYVILNPKLRNKI